MIAVADEVQGIAAMLAETGFVDIGILQPGPGIELEGAGRGWKSQLKARIIFGGIVGL